MRTPWIETAILVDDVDKAVDLYVNKWSLFRVENSGGDGPSRMAMLRYVDEQTPFRLVLVQAEQRDAQGRLIPAATHSKLSLPKINFWLWVKGAFGSDASVEYTPWSADVVLVDPWGHMLTIYTFEEPSD